MNSLSTASGTLNDSVVASFIQTALRGWSCLSNALGNIPLLFEKQWEENRDLTDSAPPVLSRTLHLTPVDLGLLVTWLCGLPLMSLLHYPPSSFLLLSRSTSLTPSVAAKLPCGPLGSSSHRAEKCVLAPLCQGLIIKSSSETRVDLILLR